MTFQDLIDYAFPSGPPSNKRFVAKSTLGSDSILFLPGQVMETIFFNQHADVWIDLEEINQDYEDLF
jgi:hypothetical protein